MGRRGPVPNHSEDLARDPARKGGDRGDIVKGELRPVEIPEPDPKWHPIARMLWDSLEQSGQSDFYQQSDWAFAWSLCEDLHMYKIPFTDKDGNEYHKRSGQMLQTIYSAMTSLGVAVGDRLRLRMELTAPDPGESPASIAVMDDYRHGLSVVPDPPD